jgi:hypothetical protein
MNVSLKSFFIKLAIFSVFSITILLLWQQYATPRFQTNLTWLIWGFFSLSTVLIHLSLVRIEDPKRFVFSFMGTTGIKLFAYLMIILIYGFLNRETMLGFTAFFLTMYVLYSGFEVFTLLKHFKK